MNNSIYRFNLELHSTMSQVSVPALIGDTSREFRITLSDGGKPYIIEDGCTAYITIKRPTGTHLTKGCMIEGNTTIVYKFAQDPNTAAVVGIHDCEVAIYGSDNNRIATPRFTMVVNDRVYRSEDIVVTDEDKTILNDIFASESTRENNEALRIAKEEDRETNEENRKNAEEIREENEGIREANEANRKENDEKREEAYKEMESRITRNEKRITNLERGIVPDPFYTDDSMAYVKSVPDNALPYAEVNKVGGKVTEIKSVGNNRFNIANLNSAMIVKGNAFTVPEGNYNRDIFTDIGGFTEAVPMEYLDKLPYLEAGDYTLSWDEGYDQQNYFSVCTVNHLDGTIINASDGWRSGQTFNVPSDSLVTFRRGNNTSKTYTNFIITRGSSTSPYKPYVEHSFKIPLDVQQLKGYGEGDNYVDLENREFVAYYYDGEYHDKPVVTDLSSIISEDNYIEVEGGGAITAVNEGENPVKTEITYMLEVTA